MRRLGSLLFSAGWLGLLLIAGVFVPLGLGWWMGLCLLALSLGAFLYRRSSPH